LPYVVVGVVRSAWPIDHIKSSKDEDYVGM
jgi:hypothetical protein